MKELQGSKVLVIESDDGEARKHLDHVRKDRSSNPCDRPEQVVSRETEPKLAAEGRESQQCPEPGLSTKPVHDHKASQPLEQPVLPSIIEPTHSDNVRSKRQIRKPDRLNYSKLGGN